jgi:5-methylcytosine-specific restriction protein A
MAKTEFSGTTKKAAWVRCEGQCEHREGTGIDEWRCQKMLRPGDIFYDHIIPDALGGDNTLSNCQVLCRAHHDPKTQKVDVPRIAKMKRQANKHIGATSPKRPWPSRPFSSSRRHTP